MKRIALAEKAGINVIWIGEFEFFKDPFYVAEIVGENSSLYIGLILSPLRRTCGEIVDQLKLLTKKYDNILLGLIPGSFSNPRDAVDAVVRCAEVVSVPVFIGCSSPRITQVAAKLADGILFNYVYPTYIQWIKQNMEKDIFTAAFGPSLLLPSSFYQDLLLAAAIVMGSSKAFLKAFELEKIYKNFLSIDLSALIKARQNGVNLEELSEFELFKEYSRLLIEKFTISGNLKSIVERINDLLKLCNHIVLGDPFFRDVRAVKLLKDIVNAV